MVAGVTLCLGSALIASEAKTIAKAATGDSADAGYHVGANIDTQDDAQVYTDATYTTVGTKVGNGRVADTPFVYKAVFEAGVTDAHLGFQLNDAYGNVKIEATNDISDATSWTTVLQAMEANDTLIVPDETASFRMQVWETNWWNYYLDLSDFLSEEGASPVYVRFSKYDENSGVGGTFVGDLKFFEGNPVNENNDAFAFVGGRELVWKDGSLTLNTDSFYTHNKDFREGAGSVGVGGHGIYADSYAFISWEFVVSGEAEKVSVDFNAQGGQDNLCMKIFAGGKMVYANSKESKDHNLGAGIMSVDLTDELSDFLGKGEDFKIYAVWSNLNAPGGGGPYMNYAAFRYELPAASLTDGLAPEYSGTGIQYGEKADGFTVKDALSGVGEKAGKVENNDRVAYMYGAYNGSGNPYFDASAYGIFKLNYPAGALGGYLAVDVNSNYNISVYTGSAWDTVQKQAYGGDDNIESGEFFDNYTNFTTVALSTLKVNGRSYVDVSDYLANEGGVLYVKISDPTLYDGSGPELTGEISLYLWKEDTTAFTASYDNSAPVKNNEIVDLVINIVSISAHEEIGRVRIDGSNLSAEDYALASGKLTVFKGAIEGLSVGEHTVEIITDQGRSVEVKYTIAAADSGNSGDSSSDDGNSDPGKRDGCGSVMFSGMALGVMLLAGAGSLLGKKSRKEDR